MINEEYLFFEKLNLTHVMKMMSWGEHEDHLFVDYNFKFRTKEECKDFLLQKTLLPVNKYYAIIYSEEVIGFLGTKNINFLKKSSTLGIVLNPDVVNMGFGKVALKKFLNFYFNEQNMRKMDLLVAGYNPRAKKLYEKMGFKKTKRFLELYPNGNNIDINSQEMKPHKMEFVQKGNILYNYVYKMELKKEDFNIEICN